MNVASQEPFVIASKKIVGEYGVYPLMAIEKLKVKAAWQLYAGTHDVAPSDANAISKFIDEYEEELKYADEEEKEHIHVEDFIPSEYIDLFNDSKDYRGITINLKVHACFTKDQLVLTSVGYKKIQDICVGDYVLTHDNSYQCVVETFVNKSNDVYKIKITGDELELTENHPVYVRTRIPKSIPKRLSEPYWKEASKITKDDWVGSPINTNSIIPKFTNNNKTYKSRYLDLTDDKFWWFVGRYLGDGWTENPERKGKKLHRVVICCNSTTECELNEIIKMIPEYLNYNVTKARTTYKITFENKLLYDYLEQFGKYAHGKRLTNDIIDLPIDKLRFFLIGYLTADGSIRLSENGENVAFQFCTVSKELAYGLQQCIHKVYHVPCTIVTNPEGIDIIEGRTVTRRKKYRGTFVPGHEYIEKTVNKFIDGMIWFKVRDICKTDIEADVYNLSVLNSNSYSVNNFAVHNCGHLLLDGDIRREIGLISAVSKTTKKRTLCACIEGKVLDDFGLIKEDYLIVDSVSLTHECFEAIGEPVPSFETLKKMVKNDDATWDIYARGITCCVNQCERESTIIKLMKYKPKSFAELSAFIAAIRPGFSSLLNTFLNRVPYTTGETEIDSILSSSSSFMLYQESIMKVLNFLGMDMGDTYKVVKNISKKKYKDHPEELDKLKNRLITAWNREIGNSNNFNNVWNVIESSGLYAFNCSHSVAMAGDSLYQAWFKAHYTTVFYEVAIKHYQNKGKKDKIDALIKEMIKFYNYRLGDYHFGNDNRVVNIDDINKIIYPNISSIKSFGEKVGKELYELGQNKDSYKTFLDVIDAFNRSFVNKTIFKKLITIDYFSDYGEINYLLEIVRLHELLYGKSEILKTKIKENNLPEELFKKYGNETAKKYTKLDSASILNELIDKIDCPPITKEEAIIYEFEVFGIVKTVIPDYPKRILFVTEVKENKAYSVITLYDVRHGVNRTVKIWNNCFTRKKIKSKDFIFITSLDKKPKREPTGEINPKTGKKIYRDIPDQYEFWLQKYEIIGKEEYDG